MNPIKLILASLFALVSACSESANQAKSAQESRPTINSYESASEAVLANPNQFVAGIAPHQRPENAPTIVEFTNNDQRRKQLLAGISEPIPASLTFIDNQEAWYTPFNQPGIPGYYDLRNWHDNARGSDHAGQ